MLRANAVPHRLRRWPEVVHAHAKAARKANDNFDFRIADTALDAAQAANVLSRFGMAGIVR